MCSSAQGRRANWRGAAKSAGDVRWCRIGEILPEVVAYVSAEHVEEASGNLVLAAAECGSVDDATEDESVSVFQPLMVHSRATRIFHRQGNQILRQQATLAVGWRTTCWACNSWSPLPRLRFLT